MEVKHRMPAGARRFTRTQMKHYHTRIEGPASEPPVASSFATDRALKIGRKSGHTTCFLETYGHEFATLVAIRPCQCRVIGPFTYCWNFNA
jgi:hypothetical protein